MIPKTPPHPQCNGCGNTMSAVFYYLDDAKCHRCASECIEHEMFSVAFARGFTRLLEPYLPLAEAAGIKMSTVKYLAEEALYESMANLNMTTTNRVQ